MRVICYTLRMKDPTKDSVYMRILLIGKSGQLGSELRRVLQAHGTVFAPSRDELDLEDIKSIRSELRRFKPRIILNAAAYTNVDRAEVEWKRAFAVNATAPAVIAEVARDLGATMIHYSTDYVFDGKKETPYIETDRPNPINIYGASKLAGERSVQAIVSSHFIFRTSWVYSMFADNFVTKVLRWSRENQTLRIVKDQISSPTWAAMLAKITAQVILEYILDSTAPYGIYHLTSDGFTSRFEWANTILSLDKERNEQIVKTVLPVSSSEFVTAATRPAYSVLDCGRFQTMFNIRRFGWKKALIIAMR